MAFENLFIRVQRSIGGIQLDSTLEESHNNTVELTQNPIEAGVDITDHAITRPKIVRLRAVVTDSPLGVAAFAKIVDTITGFFGTSTSSNITRSQQAYNALVVLQEAKEPITLTTRLVVYENMIITGIESSQDKDTSRAAFMDITLEQIIITESKVVTVSNENLASGNIRKQASLPNDLGRQEAQSVLENTGASVLSNIISLF